MCGIFALILLAQNKKNSVATPFSWRQLWNQLYTLKARGPDNMQLKSQSEDVIFGF